MRKEERRVRGYSELCLHFRLPELPDKDIFGMSELENEVHQDLMQAVREVSRVGEERRRRERRRELAALGRNALKQKLEDIEILEEAHAPLCKQDEIDAPLIRQILHRKLRRGARR